MIRSPEKFYSNSSSVKPQAGSVSVGLCEGEPTRVILRSPEKNYPNPSLNQAGSVSNS